MQNQCWSRACRQTYLDSELSLREVHRALLCLLQGLLTLVLGQPSANGTGLLCAKVERHVLLVLVEKTELGALVGVDDCENLGDRLADVVAVRGESVSLSNPSLQHFFHPSSL